MSYITLSDIGQADPETTAEKWNKKVRGGQSWRWTEASGVTCPPERPYGTYNRGLLGRDKVCVSRDNWDDIQLRGVVSALVVPAGAVAGGLGLWIMSGKARLGVIGALIGAAAGGVAAAVAYPSNVKPE